MNNKKIQESFEEALIWLQKEYASLHTGRATPTVLDGVYVESYGSMQPVKNCAAISIEDPKTLRVVPWDSSLVKQIEKSVNSADIGLSVSVDDKGMRIIFPMMTTENRLKLVKTLKERLEDARIKVRKRREDFISEIKNLDSSEDEKKSFKDNLQKEVDSINIKLEQAFSKKESEVMN